MTWSCLSSRAPLRCQIEIHMWKQSVLTWPHAWKSSMVGMPSGNRMQLGCKMGQNMKNILVEWCTTMAYCIYCHLFDMQSFDKALWVMFFRKSENDFWVFPKGTIETKLETTTPERREKKIHQKTASAGGVHWRCCNRTAGHQGGVEIFTNVWEMHIAQNHWTCKMDTVYQLIYMYIYHILYENKFYLIVSIQWCSFLLSLAPYFFFSRIQISPWSGRWVLSPETAGRYCTKTPSLQPSFPWRQKHSWLDFRRLCRSSRPRPLCKTARIPSHFDPFCHFSMSMSLTWHQYGWLKQPMV